MLLIVLTAGDGDPAEDLDGGGSATPHVGTTMSDAEQAEFAAAIADCENATVQFCPSGRLPTCSDLQEVPV